MNNNGKKFRHLYDIKEGILEKGKSQGPLKLPWEVDIHSSIPLL